MASYLWRRGPNWFFQLRPPHDLQHILSATPLRIRLPVRTYREACRLARDLAGIADREFVAMRYAGINKIKIGSQLPNPDWTAEDIKDVREITRKAVLKTLNAEIQELSSLNAQYQSLEQQKTGRAPDDQLQLAEAQKHVFASTVGAWARFARALAAEHSEAVADLRSGSIASSFKDEKLSNALDDAQDSDKKAKHLETKVSEIGLARQEAIEINARTLGQVTETLGIITELGAKVAKKGPKLSECKEDFIEAKINQLGKDSVEIKYFKHRIDAFIAIIGDKQIGTYHVGDLGDFATALSFLPKHHSLDQQWKRKTKRKTRIKSLVKAISVNKGKPIDERETSLSRKTIKVNYVGKIKTIIRWLCAVNEVSYPFLFDRIFVPVGAPDSAIRYGLGVDALHRLFAKATSQCEGKRPEDVWLPLVAYLTGARLNELVCLQPHNIIKRDDVWIINLAVRLRDDKGVRNRPTKNRESQRHIAIHHELVRLGFVDWARKQGEQGHDYVFPRLHDNTARPGHVASKRLQRLFNSLREDDPDLFDGHVFHSLRHTFKDWLRSREVAERTIALQAGHSLEGIALQYGSKILRHDELRRLANLPLTEGLKLDAYIGVADRLRPQLKRNIYKKIQKEQPSKSECTPSEDVTTRHEEKKPASKPQMELSDVQSRTPAGHPTASSPSIAPESLGAGDAAVDVKTLRKRLFMTQAQFATAFGIPAGTIRDWEQGRCSPNPTARSLLRAIAQDSKGMSRGRLPT